MPAPANRATTIAGWITAVVVCCATAFLLVTIVDGYVLAMHHRLPPNDTFGFRDATTLSCPSAWYAGQKAGFAWLLFGAGPLLVFNSVFCVAAAIKRRSPWDVVAMSMGTLVPVVVIVVIAGIHADSVAGATNTATTCSPAPLEQFAPSFNLPNRLAAMSTAGSFAFALILIGGLLIRNWSRAANGRLQRNPHFGIRTPSTMRSEDAWVAGNRAALRLVPLYRLAGVAGISCVTVFFVLTIFTAVVASRAARSADGSVR
jgi:SdpI/YhfL family protein